ncbi:MAG: hypothetical protein A2020_10505 [Lentisphaerae bacterium GWF2_45_14]|nr:MAG: hypothetical protein A2020_10505 [Lentisphaerae bacterium GWF2_45_14]
MKILIIGGVAAGASAAAKMARIDSNAEIIMFERGDYISFANCGLPYYVGNIIKRRDNLIVMTPEKFMERTGVGVRLGHEIIAINKDAKTVSYRKKGFDETFSESYDKLLICTGASPMRQKVSGADLPEVLNLWTIPDMDGIKSKVDAGAKRAVVIGGGFIGIEAAENLVERGVQTSIVHRREHLMPNLDPEMARSLAETALSHGIKLYLGKEVSAIEKDSSGLKVKLNDGDAIETDLVVMSIGARPNSGLARDAGLELGERGGIKVNEYLQTSDPNIYAAGDVIEVRDIVSGSPSLFPFAGPANRQGRIAAINMLGEEKEKYKGSIGTSICQFFDVNVASCGASEARLAKSGTEYLKTYVLPMSHASYYPGAETMIIKLLFTKEGKILGTQITGRDGVDKRIDVFAAAIGNGLTVHDLEEMELAYAPPFASAKDPVNYAGFVAGNIIKGDSDVIFPENIPDGAFLLDVREEEEFTAGNIPGSQNIPLGKLRKALDKLPKERLIVSYCKIGVRGYLAERLLKVGGFHVKNLCGGYTVWKLFTPFPLPQPDREQFSTCASTISCPVTDVASAPSSEVRELNACGLQCPGPIVEVKKALEEMKNGEILSVKASDKGFYSDIQSWCTATGNKLVSIEKGPSEITASIQKGQGASASTPISKTSSKNTSMVVFSNDLDKVMAAFIIATGFASLGHNVTMFFTFWGLNVLRKENPPPVKKDILSRMFGFMMPRGAKKLALSQMHMMGMGTAMMKHVMKSKNVNNLPELIAQARFMGVKFLACEMAMNVMGITKEELLDNVDTAGVASFAALSENSVTTLFI